MDELLSEFALAHVEGSATARSPSWKPSTVEATNCHCRSAILPALGHLRVGSVVRADIARFFHEYGRKKPGGANRSHEILRNMFDCVIAWGHRPEATGKPCKGTVRYRRPPRGRLLGAVLRLREGEIPVCVAAVRLLPLTGCRLGEIRRLRWCEVKPDRLALIYAKTAPRHVLLGEAARELLHGLAETAAGEWRVPGGKRNEPLTTNELYWFWRKTRDATGIVADARLHDLRHRHASHVVMNGESLHVAGRMLGHRRASTINRYVRLDDATLSDATERLAIAIDFRLRYSDLEPNRTTG